MKYTNKLGLPSSIVNAITKDSYTKGDNVEFSITQLIDSPRITQLSRRHAGEVEIDVADGFYILLGHAIHDRLEKFSSPDVDNEIRFYADVALDHVSKPVRISGKIDELQRKESGTYLLRDWKITSVWGHVFSPEGKSEWTRQLNAYVSLIEMSEPSTIIDELEIVALFRDWSARDFERSHGGYPEHPIMKYKIPLIPKEERDAILKAQVLSHKLASMVNDEKYLPHCTPEQRWQKPDKFAVYEYVKGKDQLKQKAYRVLDTYEEATNMVNNMPTKKLKIVHRKGEATRCEKWCNVSQFCNQYQESK